MVDKRYVMHVLPVVSLYALSTFYTVHVPSERLSPNGWNIPFCAQRVVGSNPRKVNDGGRKGI